MKIPFTVEQLFDIFETYNTAIWPSQVAAYVLGIVALGLALRENKLSGKFISGILALFWIWIGIFYYFIHLSVINPTARILGLVYILQGVLFLLIGTIHGRLSFRFNCKPLPIFGVCFVLYAMVIYPLLGLGFGHSYPRAGMFGVAPCPTTIFTFGILLWATKPVPAYLLIIPLLWSFFGIIAAVNWRVYEDYGLVVAGVLGTILILIRNRKAKEPARQHSGWLRAAANFHSSTGEKAMRLPLYQVDAFTSEVFYGNPAAVCLLDRWIDDSILQAVAAENNLSETAFLVRHAEGFDLRWFTPVTEVALCGHGTLASAFVLFNCQKWPEENIRFRTRKSGELVVTRRNDLLEMDFPARPAYAQSPPAGLKEALRVTPQEVLGSEEDLLVVLDSEKTVREVQPDFIALDRVACRGTIITASGDRSDFVSRFFAPRVGIPEDPVTGSAHCVLAPYWAGVLRKNDLHAFQVSRRGGELFCTHVGERVKISGKAALYMEGTITI